MTSEQKLEKERVKKALKSIKKGESQKKTEQNATRRQDKPKATRNTQNMIYNALTIPIKINKVLSHDYTYMTISKG
jgi:hypothetical protein